MNEINNSSELYIAASQKKKERNYWLEQLAGDWIKASFPYDEKKVSLQQNETGAIHFKLPDDTFLRVIKLSNGTDMRIYILLLAGLVLLLHRYTSNKDIIVGAPIYKQDYEAEYINTVLPLRNRLEDRMNFKDLVLQVGKTIFEASEHQNYPIKTLLYQLGMDYDEKNFPLFDIAILLENIHNKKDIQHVNPNMIFSFLRTDRGLEGVLEYNASLFRQQEVEKIIARFEYLFNNAIHNVELQLPEIDMLSEEEKDELLNTLNDNKRPYTQDKSVTGLFEEQVKNNPHAAAARYENKEITYVQLNEKANQLARCLREKGVGKDTIVGIMLDRSIDMLVGMMAVLKAGGAYLPISIELPTARKRFILEDSSAAALLTHSKVIEKNESVLESSAGISRDDVLLLDEQNIYRGETCSMEIENEDRKSHTLAYVIYTSGTTGKPKGVMIEHSALVNFIYSMYENYNNDFSPRDNCLSLTNISFDVSVCELFVPLAFGSTVIFISDEEMREAEKLARFIVDNEITFAYIPPALLKDLCENLKTFGERVIFDKLLVGVEPIKDSVLAMYLELNDTIQVVNGYGPTEATICATFYRFNSHKTNGMNVPIGKPLPNTQIVILDQQQRLYPFAVPGELCISGNGLARGYLNCPELTSEKFAYHPYFPGKSMYKTGDFAKWLTGGNILFLGRIDHQIKIRGYRIEPGEIENRLMNHEKIEKAVVIERENKNGDRFLCAYFVPQVPGSGSDPASIPNVAELINFLSKELPGYMIPLHFIQLDNIPLNQNGKLDRNALPNPQVDSKVEYVAPKNDMEKQVADIWKEILKLDKVGIHDNFFEIGGNSLSIIRLKSILSEILGQEIPDVKMLEYPTINSFCSYFTREFSNDSIQEKEIDPYETESNQVNKLRLRNRLIKGDQDV